MTARALVEDAYRRRVTQWLAALSALVLAMVVVGGITRLTGSGLSIVEWRPVTGALPPLSDADWVDAFRAYQTSPQYKLVNVGMSIAEFKRIFLWEYVHRLLGRFVGLAFVVPWVYFTLRRAFRPAFALRMLVVLALGGAQGVLGWLMVKSGLATVPHVSPYRLAAHLALALTLLSLLFTTWLDLRGEPQGASRRAHLATRATLGLIAVQIVYGAFTAGLHAGVGYNTFPTMHGAWVPPDALALAPLWRNAFENPAAVQFMHRALAALVVVAVTGLVASTRRDGPAVRRAAWLVAAAVAVQFALGVATLVLVVPVALAVIHQLGACLLLLAALRARTICARAATQT